MATFSGRGEKKVEVVDGGAASRRSELHPAPFVEKKKYLTA